MHASDSAAQGDCLLSGDHVTPHCVSWAAYIFFCSSWLHGTADSLRSAVAEPLTLADALSAAVPNAVLPEPAAGTAPCSDCHMIASR